jgi:hypothetical protein
LPPHNSASAVLPLRQALTRSVYAYRISESGRTYPVIVDCNSLEQAVDGAKIQCFHKEHLLIREVGNGRDRLHIYAIRQKSTPRYVHKDHVTRAVRDLYAAPVCSFDGAMLAGVGE